MSDADGDVVRALAYKPYGGDAVAEREAPRAETSRRRIGTTSSPRVPRRTRVCVVVLRRRIFYAVESLLQRLVGLVADGKVRVSLHGYQQLMEDGLSARELVAGLDAAVVIEEYLDYPKGPCILVLERGQQRRPIHAVWGIPKGAS